jgi:hypothetical protein
MNFEVWVDMSRHKKVDYSAFHKAGFYSFIVITGIFFLRGIL